MKLTFSLPVEPTTPTGQKNTLGSSVSGRQHRACTSKKVKLCVRRLASGAQATERHERRTGEGHQHVVQSDAVATACVVIAPTEPRVCSTAVAWSHGPFGRALEWSRKSAWISSFRHVGVYLPGLEPLRGEDATRRIVHVVVAVYSTVRATSIQASNN